MGNPLADPNDFERRFSRISNHSSVVGQLCGQVIREYAGYGQATVRAGKSSLSYHFSLLVDIRRKYFLEIFREVLHLEGASRLPIMEMVHSECSR
jgi:hypothetical protein